jgi:hypothetical protein
MIGAKTPEAVVETARRWAEAGGTHAAVNSMGLGFETVQDHVDWFARIADAARAAELM